LLEQTIGRDVSKFFYGGYALDGNLNTKPGDKNMAHPHSNIARKIAFKHIVGVIGQRYVQENLFTVDHSDTNFVTKNTSAFTLNAIEGKN
jgi:hypothetical protein